MSSRGDKREILLIPFNWEQQCVKGTSGMTDKRKFHTVGS